MRILIFLLIAGVAGVIMIAKKGFGAVSKNEELRNTDLKKEAKAVMDNTAKGISWMEQQWEDSKKNAEKEKTKNLDHD